VIPEHVMLLRETALPVAAILRAGQGSFARDETTRRGHYYAACWALTHYLLLGDDQRYRKGLAKYLSTVEAGSEDPEQDFVDAIGVSLKKIEDGLGAYVHQDAHPVQIYTLAEKLDYEQEMTSFAMSESEVAYYLGDALLHSQRMTEAESYLRKALALDPANADANASFGIMRLRQERTVDAKAALEKAVVDPSVKPIAHYYYARAFLHDGGAGGLSKETSQEALAHLTKALELMPHYAPAYDLLAFVNLASDQEIDESIRLVQTGIRLAPKRTGFLLTLAQLQLRKRDWAGARKSLSLILARKPDESLKRLASELLEETDSREEDERRRKEQRRLDEAEAARILERQAQRAGDSGGATDASPPTEVPGRTDEQQVSARPQCRPAFVEVSNRRSMSGTLTDITPVGEGLAFTLTTQQGRFVFFAPDRNAPLIYSCTVNFGGRFDYSKLHHSAIAYFDAAPAGGRYAGRLVAIDIVSTQPE